MNERTKLRLVSGEDDENKVPAAELEKSLRSPNFRRGHGYQTLAAELELLEGSCGLTEMEMLHGVSIWLSQRLKSLANIPPPPEPTYA